MFTPKLPVTALSVVIKYRGTSGNRQPYRKLKNKKRSFCMFKRTAKRRQKEEKSEPFMEQNQQLHFKIHLFCLSNTHTDTHRHTQTHTHTHTVTITAATFPKTKPSEKFTRCLVIWWVCRLKVYVEVAVQGQCVFELKELQVFAEFHQCATLIQVQAAAALPA